MDERECSIKTFVEGFHDKHQICKMKYHPLGNTDMVISHLGYGGSAVSGRYSDVDINQATSVVETALKNGINYIDTAPWYGFGKSEVVLGQALKSVPRNSYYIATKVGRYEPEVSKMFDFSREMTLKSVEISLQKLGCGYIDIIQIHDVEFAPNLDIILNETLPTLQELKNSGKVRYIGVTGYPLQTLKAVIEGSQLHIDTVLSYCRCCCHDTELLNYIPYFKSKGLGVIDAAGVGMGLYTNSKLPDWHPAFPEIRRACVDAAQFCKEKNVDFTKLAVHFNLTQDGADTHLISCSELSVLEKNLDVCINGLTNDEQLCLSEILERYFNPLKTRNWEGVELEKYNRKLSQK